jgi:hypothetical protein
MNSADGFRNENTLFLDKAPAPPGECGVQWPVKMSQQNISRSSARLLTGGRQWRARPTHGVKMESTENRQRILTPLLTPKQVPQE